MKREWTDRRVAPLVCATFAAAFAVLATAATAAVHFDAEAHTWNVQGCEFEDVRDALLSAQDGDTVQLGAGHCDWGNDAQGHPLWVVVPISGKSIRVRGMGVDRTIIHRTTPVGGAEEPLIYFSCGVGGTLELAHIRFLGNDDEQEDDPATRRADLDIGIQMNGRCVDFRLHDLVFEKFSNAGIMLRGAGYRQAGVIHDSKFISNYKCYPLGQPDNDYPCYGYGVALFGSDDWPDPAWGSGEKVYIEANQFYDNRHPVAAHRGARFVVRHNRILGSERTARWALDAHGYKEVHHQNGDVEIIRGTRSWEIYNNLIGTEVTASSPVNYAQVFVPRGGDGIFAHNVLQGRFADTMRIMVETYTTDCLFPDGWPGGPHQRLPDQTTEAWIWGNHHTTREAFPVADQHLLQRITHVSGPYDCAYWLREGLASDPPETWEYTQQPKPGWVPWTYPHPLRAQGDRIFRDDFDWY